ncbi:NHL repeat-containing protein [Hyalangium versicolor]|uniref:NHL repeat-containing protein n=1 Tax=Hyalangium versicolor TaxID=2861190 RepID=UPI001CCB7611|nr:NHL repeat-containing protein [Hyalangium versicolor]
MDTLPRRWRAALHFPVLLVLCAACDSKTPAHTPEASTRQTAQALTLTRGLPGDLIADMQVGKRDFVEISPREIVPDKVSAPGGVVVDRSVSPGRAYVWDSGNSRILGIDLAACYAARQSNQRCTAALVFGQPSASDHGACNRDSSFQSWPQRPPSSASTLCGMPESTHTTLEDKSFANMLVDGQGNLYVPDMGNHRVLKFIQPWATDTVADEVWGQPDFASNLCNTGGSNTAPTASSLCFSSISGSGGGVRLDAQGNLWVADGGNNRVLRFPVDANGQISKTADLVLGQPNLTTGGDWSHDSAMNRMHAPQTIAFDPNGRLYVADLHNSRILVFQPPFTSGMAATATFGSFAQDQGPMSVELDPDGRGLWATNHYVWDTQIRLWSWTGTLLAEPPRLTQHGGGAIGFDAQKRMLLTSYVYGQDVERLTPQANGSYLKDLNFFTPPGSYNLTTARRLEHSAWVGVAVTQNQLFVSDGRLLFWNDPATLTQGEAPDGYVGASSATEIPSPGFGQLKADASGRVWATKTHEIRVYQAPLTTGASSLKTISSVNVLGGGSISFADDGEVYGLAPTPEGGYLWVAQPRLHRVFRIRGPLTASPVVDIILGQTSATGTQCNQGIVPAPNTGTPLVADLTMLCYPGALSLDRQGNLYVSDHFLEAEGNWRMLMFRQELFPSAPTAVLYAPAASKEFPRDSTPEFPHAHMTFEPAFDSSNRMVVGFNPYSGERFVQVYDDPTLVNPSNPRDPAYARPTSQLADFYGWAVGATFDAEDNLYVYDANRGRVMIYFTPFAAPATFNVTGAVGVSGSDMLDGNRLTRGPCPGTPFITAAGLGSTIHVTQPELGEARWNCDEPAFYFGDYLGQPMPLGTGTRTFTFTPPAGYQCVWYAAYGTRDNESFDVLGDACSVTVELSQDPGDLFLWYFVLPKSP